MEEEREKEGWMNEGRKVEEERDDISSAYIFLITLIVYSLCLSFTLLFKNIEVINIKIINTTVIKITKE